MLDISEVHIMKLGLNPTSLHVSKCQAPVCKVCVCVCMAKYCLVQCDQTICYPGCARGEMRSD